MYTTSCPKAARVFAHLAKLPPGHRGMHSWVGGVQGKHWALQCRNASRPVEPEGICWQHRHGTGTLFWPPHCCASALSLCHRIPRTLPATTLHIPPLSLLLPCPSVPGEWRKKRQESCRGHFQLSTEKTRLKVSPALEQVLFDLVKGTCP